MLGAQIVVGGGSTFNLWIPQDDLPSSISLKSVSQSTTSGCWACMNTVNAQGGIQYSLPTTGNSITFDLSSYVGTTGMWLKIYEKSGYTYTGEVTTWSK